MQLYCLKHLQNFLNIQSHPWIHRILIHGLNWMILIDSKQIDKTPFFIRLFSVKEDMKPKIDKEMQRLETLGILKKGLSGYSSPAMPIPRKNSNIPRVVADFRHLNTKLLQLNMTFPLVRECIQQIGASQCEVMSVIDLRDAYHTLRLAPESQQFCGITPYYGSDTYLYQRLPMGLKVSPAIWQAFINKVLGPIPNRQRHIAIMDDCLVHSKRMDHWSDLRNLFQSLLDHGLKISPRKCQFFRTSLIYMGYRFLIDDGKPSFTPMKDKCEAIRALETPKNVKDCRKFCGMVNFLATFLPSLQKHLIPIYNLTKKNILFKWTDECQKSFDIIKELLTKPPILHMPNTTGLYTLMSDTSIVATGGVLYQNQGITGRKHIIGFNSKKLPAAAKNYSITELELFGLVINIHAFKELLFGRYFECFCDHSALTYIFQSKKKKASRRIDRLVNALNEYNFSIYYLPGQKMHIADLLSRLAGHDLDPPDKVIPISFAPLRSLRSRNKQPLDTQLFTTSKSKPSQLPSYVPPKFTPRLKDFPLIAQYKPPKAHKTENRMQTRQTSISQTPAIDIPPSIPDTRQTQTASQIHSKRSSSQSRKSTPRSSPSQRSSSSPPPRMSFVFPDTTSNNTILEKTNNQQKSLDQPRTTLINPHLDIRQTLTPVELPPPQ